MRWLKTLCLPQYRYYLPLSPQTSAKPYRSLIEVEDNDGVDDNEEVLEVKNDVEGEAKGNTDNNQSGRKCGVWNIFEDNSLCI